MAGRVSNDFRLASIGSGFVRFLALWPFLLSVALICVLTTGGAQAQGYRGQEFDAPSRFQGERYDRLRSELGQYGRWLDHPIWGEVWQPDTGRNWRPFADGQWDFDPEGGGWTWVSNEDFGGIVYHYGRWDLDERRGWIWVPGNEWSPAWVMWRKGAGVIGWAPLPPDKRRFGDSSRRDDDGGPFDLVIAEIWMFVDFEDFDSERVYRYALDPADNEDMLDETEPVFEIETERSGDYVGSSYSGDDRYAVYPVPILRPRTTLRLFDNFDIILRDYRRPRRVYRSERRFVYRPIIGDRSVYIQSPERRRARANQGERRRFVRDANRGRKNASGNRRPVNVDRGRGPKNAGRREARPAVNRERPRKAAPIIVAPRNAAGQLRDVRPANRDKVRVLGKRDGRAGPGNKIRRGNKVRPDNRVRPDKRVRPGNKIRPSERARSGAAPERRVKARPKKAPGSNARQAAFPNGAARDAAQRAAKKRAAAARKAVTRAVPAQEASRPAAAKPDRKAAPRRAEVKNKAGNRPRGNGERNPNRKDGRGKKGNRQ